MIETIGQTPLAWVTNGDETFKIKESDLDTFLESNPTFRRGRSNLFRKKSENEESLEEENNKLFLINGTVRMNPLSPGRTSIQSDQMRIIWANSVNTAMQKYENYFNSLNNPQEQYVVINMAVTEAIS